MDAPNTHGFEVEENEHDVVDKIYLDIIPREKLSDIVVALKNQAGQEWKSRCTDHFAWKAADHIIELENKIEFYENIIRRYHLDNDAFTGKGNIK